MPKDYFSTDLPQEADLPIFNDPSKSRTTPHSRITIQQEAKNIQKGPEKEVQKSNKPLEEASTAREDTTTTTTAQGKDGDIYGPNDKVPLHIEESELQEAQLPKGERNLATLPSTIAGPIRLIKYSQVKDRKSLIEQLSKTIPTNEYNMPVFIYRPDLLCAEDFQTIPTKEEAVELQNKLSMAIFSIDYAQGFPVCPDGLPLWSILPWETPDAYNAFTEYCENSEGIRSLHTMQGLPLQELMEWFTLNYWHTRTKAYDRFQGAHKARVRIQRMVTVEDQHYKIAEKLVSIGERRLKEMTDEDYKELDPVNAAKLLELGIKVQRLSVGLPAMGVLDPAKDIELRKPKALDSEMRREALKEGESQQTLMQPQDVDILRDDPDALDIAQELFVRLNRAKIARDTPQEDNTQQTTPQEATTVGEE